MSSLSSLKDISGESVTMVALLIIITEVTTISLHAHAFSVGQLEVLKLPTLMNLLVLDVLTLP